MWSGSRDSPQVTTGPRVASAAARSGYQSSHQSSVHGSRDVGLEKGFAGNEKTYVSDDESACEHVETPRRTIKPRCQHDVAHRAQSTDSPLWTSIGKLAVSDGDSAAGSWASWSMPGSPPERSKDNYSEDSRTLKVMERMVVMRNIPCNYTRLDLLILLLRLAHGSFLGIIDFVYLPFDFKTGANLGFAFVNFVHEHDAFSFMLSVTGFKDWGIRTSKTCRIEMTRYQSGKWATIERLRNHGVMHPNVPEEFRPLLFNEAGPLPFPPPTAEIAEPSANFRSDKFS